MKNPFKNASNRTFLGAWISFHGGLLLFFLLSLILGKKPVSIDTDLFNMIPKPMLSASIKAADEKMTRLTSEKLFILVSHEDFNEAKKAAASLYDSLKESDNFSTLELYTDMTSVSGITDFLFDYRWNLLDENTASEIISSPAKVQSFSEQALASAFSPFTMTSLDRLDEDPFMLTELALKNYLAAIQSSGTAMSDKDGVLAAQFEGRWYVMVRASLSKKGARLASKNDGITEIYKNCDETGKHFSNVNFTFTGTPYHSHESSLSASKEITIISVISLLAVLFILLFVFRSAKPVIFSLVSISISVITAFLITLGVFRNMHILTLVFGTSLIGSSIDYSLHFFTHWAGNKELASGSEIRGHLLPGLTMAIISTGICYAVLLFAPFTLLKQISLFSLSGLVSSFLTTIGLFPFIKLPSDESRFVRGTNLVKIKNPAVHKKVSRIGITALVVLPLILAFIFRGTFGIKNNISNLYNMEGQLLQDEILSSKILKYSPTGWFIISGNSEEELLQTEEELALRVKETLPDTGFLCTSMFIPSIKKQKYSLSAASHLLEYADFQEDALGFSEDEALALKKAFSASQNSFISPEAGNIPEYLMEAVSSVWLGKIDGKYYSVLVPNQVSDAAVFKNLSNNENIYFVSKVADMSSDLDRLTKMILEFFALAFVIMTVILLFFYSKKQTAKIISVPLLIILVTSAVFATTKTWLEFFSVTGIILVFGLGLDYVIYMVENEKNTSKNRDLEPFATFLSFVTTVISFGALALSSFTPVHLIGFAIFLGLTTAYATSRWFSK